MEYIRGKAEALARAHHMRSMRDDGLSTALIAAYFKYGEWVVEAMIQWHEKMYPDIKTAEAQPWFLSVAALPDRRQT